jgi:hypothetical protein
MSNADSAKKGRLENLVTTAAPPATPKSRVRLVVGRSIQRTKV